MKEKNEITKNESTDRLSICIANFSFKNKSQLY